MKTSAKPDYAAINILKSIRYHGAPMKALGIRNLPDDVHEAMKVMAAANHRSLLEQARYWSNGRPSSSTPPGSPPPDRGGISVTR